MQQEERQASKLHMMLYNMGIQEYIPKLSYVMNGIMTKLILEMVEGQIWYFQMDKMKAYLTEEREDIQAN